MGERAIDTGVSHLQQTKESGWLPVKEELKQVFRSKYFLFSFILLFLCFSGYSFPGWFCAIGIEEEYRESALQLSIGSIFFGSVMMFMPFCASVSHAVSQVEELSSGMMHWRVLRSSLNRYASIKMAASALSAACSTTSAFIIHAILWNVIAIPVDPVHYQAHEIGFADTCVFSKWYLIAHGLPVYVEIALGIAFSAAVWAIVALAVAVWILTGFWSSACPLVSITYGICNCPIICLECVCRTRERCITMP